MFLFSVTIPDFDNTPHKIGENSTTVDIDAREGGLVLVEGNHLGIPAPFTKLLYGYKLSFGSFMIKLTNYSTKFAFS